MKEFEIESIIASTLISPEERGAILASSFCLTPKQVALDDFPWTPREVQVGFYNAWSVLDRLPDKDRALLSKVTTMDWQTLPEPGDYADGFLSQLPLRIPMHHIDQMLDSLEWQSWLTVDDRKLVWGVARCEVAGRHRIPWERLKKDAGLTSWNRETLKRRLARSHEYVAWRLTKLGWPRRRADDCAD